MNLSPNYAFPQRITSAGGVITKIPTPVTTSITSFKRGSTTQPLDYYANLISFPTEYLTIVVTYTTIVAKCYTRPTNKLFAQLVLRIMIIT